MIHSKQGSIGLTRLGVKKQEENKLEKHIGKQN